MFVNIYNWQANIEILSLLPEKNAVLYSSSIGKGKQEFDPSRKRKIKEIWTQTTNRFVTVAITNSVIPIIIFIYVFPQISIHIVFPFHFNKMDKPKMYKEFNSKNMYKELIGKPFIHWYLF